MQINSLSVKGWQQWGWLIIALVLSGCSSDPGSPDQQIRALVAQAQTAAEARDLGELRGLIAEDYRDGQGNDQKAVENLLRFYLLRNQSVHLFTRIRDLQVTSPDQATLSVAAAMAGRAITNPGELAGLNANLYRFDLELIRQAGAWRVRGASWEPARLDDFL